MPAPPLLLLKVKLPQGLVRVCSLPSLTYTALPAPSTRCSSSCPVASAWPDLAVLPVSVPGPCSSVQPRDGRLRVLYLLSCPGRPFSGPRPASPPAGRSASGTGLQALSRHVSTTACAMPSWRLSLGSCESHPVGLPHHPCLPVAGLSRISNVNHIMTLSKGLLWFPVCLPWATRLRRRPSSWTLPLSASLLALGPC